MKYILIALAALSIPGNVSAKDVDRPWCYNVCSIERICVEKIPNCKENCCTTWELTKVCHKECL
jgi:hypothetical protein